MNEIDIFMSLLDDDTIIHILKKYFGQNIRNKKIIKTQLLRLLRQPKNAVVKKYRMTQCSNLNNIILELSVRDLINLGENEFVRELILYENYTLLTIQQFCTAYLKYPEIIKKNAELIIGNYNNDEYLFKGIELLESSESVESLEIRKLKAEMRELKDIVLKSNCEIEKIKEENINVKDENRILKKERDKYQKSLRKLNKESELLKSKYESEKCELINKADKLEELNRVKDKECIEKVNECAHYINIINEFKSKYEDIRNRNIKLEEELESKMYLGYNNDYDYDEYEECFIYGKEPIVLKALFNDILFMDYKKYCNDSSEFINKINLYGIKRILIHVNNLSNREIAILRMKLDNEDIEYRLILSSNDLGIIKNIMELRKGKKLIQVY